MSLKIDGAPSVVWGHFKGKFFVCTKAFNKKKVRLCFNSEDIHTHFGHQPDVARSVVLDVEVCPPR